MLKSVRTPAFVVVMSLLGAGSASSQITKVIAEGDFFLDSDFFFVRTLNDVNANAQGGFITRVRTGSSFGDNFGMNPATSQDFYVRATTFGAPFATVREENDTSTTADDITFGTRSYQQQELNLVAINNAGVTAYGADVLYTDSAGPDITAPADRVNSIWLDNTPIAVEGDAVLVPELSGSSYTGVFFRGMGETGVPIYEGRYTDGAGSSEGLFAGASTALLKAGDAIGGTADTVASQVSAFTNTVVSLDGTSYLSAVQGTSLGPDSDYVVVDGEAQRYLGTGELITTETVIGVANGGLDATETLGSTVQNSGVGPGNWGFTSFTSASSDLDNVAIINGYVTYREEDLVPDAAGGTFMIDGPAEGIAFNAAGDVVVVYDNALILNGTVVAREGSDITNAGNDLRLFQSGVSLSERDGNGDVVIYFEGREFNLNFDTIFSLETAFDTGAILGDMDVNGVVELDDVLAFVTAMENRADYAGLYGSAVDVRGDINGDGLFNLSDVEPFAALIGVPASVVLAAVPEPGAAVLLGVLGPLALRRRRVAG